MEEIRKSGLGAYKSNDGNRRSLGQGDDNFGWRNIMNPTFIKNLASGNINGILRDNGVHLLMKL